MAGLGEKSGEFFVFATHPHRYSPIRPIKSQASGKAQGEMSPQATFSGKSHQLHRTLNATSLCFGVLETDASSTYCRGVRERVLTHLPLRASVAFEVSWYRRRAASKKNTFLAFRWGRADEEEVTEEAYGCVSQYQVASFSSRSTSIFSEKKLHGLKFAICFWDSYLILMS